MPMPQPTEVGGEVKHPSKQGDSSLTLFFCHNPKFNEAVPQAFCRGNQGDANFQVSLQKHPAALFFSVAEIAKFFP